MKTYNFRPNRPKTRDGFFRNLHLGFYLDESNNCPKSRGPPKTRWLRGITVHLQLAVVRATSDQAKGQKRTGKIPLSNPATVTALKNIGIQTKWTPCPDIIHLLQLDTSFTKGDYIRKARQLEFRLIEKIGHYFDGDNKPRKTSAAYYLCFRLLKDTPRPRTVI